MKSLAFFASLFLLSLLPAGEATATVGGPTIISRPSYHQSENAVYYTLHRQNGRGCPPEIEKIDLASGEQTPVLTCNQIEADFYRPDGSFNEGGYGELVEGVFAGLPELRAVDPARLGLTILVEYAGEHRFDEYNVASSFRATVTQAGTTKREFNFIGCQPNEPITSTAYPVSGTDKVLLKISRIGDCFEGGYLKDDVFIVSGVDGGQDGSLPPALRVGLFSGLIVIAVYAASRYI